MQDTINTEAERLPSALEYVNGRIAELDFEIAGCDYYEDIDGNMIYEPDSDPREKQRFEAEKWKWMTLRQILTQKAPFTAFD